MRYQMYTGISKYGIFSFMKPTFDRCKKSKDLQKISTAINLISGFHRSLSIFPQYHELPINQQEVQSPQHGASSDLKFKTIENISL